MHGSGCIASVISEDIEELMEESKPKIINQLS